MDQWCIHPGHLDSTVSVGCLSFTSAEEFIWKSSISTYSITIVNHVTTGKSIFCGIVQLIHELTNLIFYLTTVLISHNSSW